MLADIYVSQPMNETFYSSISDQSTGLLGLLPGTVTLMMPRYGLGILSVQ